MLATILIVEDETTIAQMLGQLFEMEGYRVVLAANGKDALARLTDLRPDVILSDIMMPVMDGKELCRALHAHPAYQRIPVVLMSAIDRPGQEELGYAAFVAKPFNLDTVLDVIGRFAAPEPQAEERQRGRA